MQESDSGVKAAWPKVSHPYRILYPKPGLTRMDVLGYYAEVAPYLLRLAKGRAITVKRWPHGVDGTMFYQKHPPEGGPILVEDLPSLLTWVAQGALEFHAPLGHVDQPLQHDWAILDLDPNPPAGWESVMAVARVFRSLLDLLEIPFLLKTSGQRGLHFYIAIEPLDHREVMAIMGRLSEMICQTVPELATLERLKRDRGNRVYLDYLQNGYQRTTVLAYSLRATPNATISTPIRWEDLATPADGWTMERVRAHLGRHGNLFEWQGPRVDLEGVARRHGLRAQERRMPSDR
ncbi:DNA polymerase domain-containing protein [Sulfobacillus harzensis]|nr:DNA primase [Sulfobacillus harzensis]